MNGLRPSRSEPLKSVEGRSPIIEQLTRQPSSPSDLEWSGLADSEFSETQEGRVDGRLKFRFARKTDGKRVIEKDQPDSF